MSDIERVSFYAETVFEDSAGSKAWLDQPLRTFQGNTPRQLIEMGRTNDVLSYLASIESGYVG